MLSFVYINAGSMTLVCLPAKMEALFYLVNLDFRVPEFSIPVSQPLYIFLLRFHPALLEILALIINSKLIHING